MADDTLFDNGQTLAPSLAPPLPGVLRLARPVRNQMELLPVELDALIPQDHQVRIVWSFVEAMDLSAWYSQIRVLEGGAGRSAIDPQILLALWLNATLDAVGSARALADLCKDHIVYRWVCGGVGVNYHTLSDFRSNSAEELDGLLTDCVARLRAAGAVTLERVALDGKRVRASAGGGSFRRQQTLERCRQEAQEQVAALRKELDADPSACSQRQKAARARAVRERAERVAAALRQYPEARAKKKHDKEETRVSITDPDARVMHMPNGGFSPAFNVHFVTDTKSQVIVDPRVLQSGSDHGQLKPAVERVEERCGARPAEVLTDGGFAKPEDIDALAQESPPCTVYAPVPELKPRGKPVLLPAAETPQVKAWRERMKTEASKEIYKDRAATAECVNALAHNRGMQQFLVRGLKKVAAVVLLFVLAHNLLRGARLCPGGWESLASSQPTEPSAGEGRLPVEPAAADETVEAVPTCPRVARAAAMPGTRAEDTS